MTFFAIPNNSEILEIGCGPGALCEALARWYPDADITGADRDSNFIEFACKNNPGLTFAEEDATALSFGDESFDCTISNTVSEHIEPNAFFGEQYRVLRKGGSCLLLSARRGIQHYAPCIAVQSDFEKEFWEKVDSGFKDSNRQNGVGAYSMTEQELPLAMEKYGFKNVHVEYITLHMTPDDPIYDKETAKAMIEAERASNLSSIEDAKNTLPELVSDEEYGKMQALVNAKYDKRLALYDAGEKQWDTYVSLIMMLRGEK